MPKSCFVLCLVLFTASATSGCGDEIGEGCTKGVFTGHVTISDKSEPALYEGYTQVTGNLTLSCPNCDAIGELRCLASVRGDLSISGNSALSSLDLGGLMHVGGSLYLHENPSLAELDLGQLRAVGDWVTIRDNDALPELKANELLAIGGDVSVSSNATLETLELAAARQIPGALTVTDNAGLQFLETPSLVAIVSGLTISGSAALADLDGFAGLRSLGGGLDVSHNGALPYCEVCQLIDQLPGFAGELICSANLADGCWSGSALDCPPPAGDGAIIGAEP